MAITSPNSEARKAAAALRAATSRASATSAAGAAAAAQPPDVSILDGITDADADPTHIITPSATPTKTDVSTVNCATEEQMDALTLEHICQVYDVEMTLSTMVCFALINKLKLLSLLCNNAIPNLGRLLTLMKSFTTEGDIWKSFAFDNTTTFFCSKSGLNQTDWEEHVSYSS